MNPQKHWGDINAETTKIYGKHHYRGVFAIFKSFFWSFQKLLIHIQWLTFVETLLSYIMGRGSSVFGPMLRTKSQDILASPVS